MVKVNPDHQAELDALIRSQAADDAERHVRRRSVRVQTATDLEVCLDGLPAPRKFDGIIPIEGRTHEWDGQEHEVCPTCHGHAGDQPCLRCDGGAWNRPLRGRVNPDVPKGPTTYAGMGSLKGGKGR